jgi:putative colanic acid biosynthesis UDP-glucose lipid carrier transferase
VPDVFAFDLIQGRLVEINGMPALSVCDTPFHGVDAALKRSTDLVLAIIGLVVASPIMIAIAAAIKLTSKGPVLFRQRRYGLNGEEILVYKFRSMTSTEDGAVVTQVTRFDSRVTPIGGIIRKTSLDELPQLFNVLLGDMSLVGPRAMSWRDYQLFEEDWQRRRFSVKPGITCLRQVKGRNSIPFEKWMELDMQYIDKWSLWLDFKILAQTLPAVLRGTGAN